MHSPSCCTILSVPIIINAFVAKIQGPYLECSGKGGGIVGAGIQLVAWSILSMSSVYTGAVALA